MADILQELISKLSLDADDFTKGIDKAITSSEGFDKWMGKLADTLLSPAGVIGGLTAIGVASFDAAKDFDEAVKKIQISTGATGQLLDSLGASFRTVFADTPARAEEVATAISTLNAVLGLTGEPLEKIAGQLLAISEMTGTPLSSNIDAVAKAFREWNVAIEDQSAFLDSLFAAYQETHIGVADLAGSLARFGPALREMGLGFQDAAAFVASFQVATGSADRAFMALNTALSNLAKQGVPDVGVALAQVMERIKGAETDTSALNLAAEVFGKRGAVVMVDAIRTGKVETEGLSKSLKESAGRVMEMHEATKTFGEKWAEIWHKIQLNMEPVGKVLLFILDQIIEEFSAFGRWFDWLWQQSIKGGEAIVTFTNKLGLTHIKIAEAKQATEQLTNSLKTQKPAIDDTSSAFETQAEKTKRLKEEQAALKAEMDRLDEAQKRDWANLQRQMTEREKWRQAIIDENKLIDDLTASTRTATVDLSGLAGAFEFMGTLTPRIHSVGEELDKLPLAIQPSIVDMTNLKSASESVTETSKKWKDFSNEVSTIITNLAQNISKSLWDGNLSWKEKGIAALKELGQAVTSLFIQPFVDAIAKFIAGALTDLLSGNGLGGVLSKLKEIGDAAASVFGGAGGAASTAGSAAGTAGSAAGSAGGSAGQAASGALGIVNAISGVVTAVSSVISNIQQMHTNEKLTLIEENTRYIKIWTGEQGEDSILGYLRKIWGLTDYLWAGMQRVEQETFKLFDITDLLTNIRDDMRISLYPQMAAVAATGGRAVTIPVTVTLDGKVVAESVVTYLEESGTRLP